MSEDLTPDTSRAEVLKQAAESGEEETARHFGFCNWNQLENFLRIRGDEDALALESDHDGFLFLACLVYSGLDSPDRRDEAAALLTDNPDLSSESIWSAACAGNIARLRELIKKDAEAVRAKGGPFEWEPLLYACYSRLPDADTLGAARVLLELGADAKAYHMWGGNTRFTALTGVLGWGKRGPINQSPHPHWQEFARLLLEKGADPNDCQALYNHMRNPDPEPLRIMIDHGLDGSQRTYYGETLEADAPQTLSAILETCLPRFYTEKAALCIDNGADLSQQVNGMPLQKACALAGYTELTTHLKTKGVSPEPLNELESFAAAVLAGDTAAADTRCDADPSLVKRIFDLDDEILHKPAAANRLKALQTAIDLGLDPNHFSYNTALHEAADKGQIEAAKLPIANGAKISQRDHWYGGTVIDWARDAGHLELVDHLATYDSLNIFDAIAVNRLDLIRKIVTEDPAQLRLTFGETRSERSEPWGADWKTPLASAITRENLEAVKLLVELGAPLDPTPDGQTLADYADENSTDEIRAEIENALKV